MTISVLQECFSYLFIYQSNTARSALSNFFFHIVGSGQFLCRDLSYNRLNGSIPASLGQLSKLQEL